MELQSEIGPKQVGHSRLESHSTVPTTNQSKFIFQAITKNYNVINATALERLPEKHYAH